MAQNQLRQDPLEMRVAQKPSKAERAKAEFRKLADEKEMEQLFKGQS